MADMHVEVVQLEPMRVAPDCEPPAGVELKDFAGGLYAVTGCRLKEETTSAFFQEHGYLESWKKLHEWVEASSHKAARHQALEKPRDPRAAEEDLVLDLYYPIER